MKKNLTLSLLYSCFFFGCSQVHMAGLSGKTTSAKDSSVAVNKRPVASYDQSKSEDQPVGAEQSITDTEEYYLDLRIQDTYGPANVSPGQSVRIAWHIIGYRDCSLVLNGSFNDWQVPVVLQKITSNTGYFDWVVPDGHLSSKFFVSCIKPSNYPTPNVPWDGGLVYVLSPVNNEFAREFLHLELNGQGGASRRVFATPGSDISVKWSTKFGNFQNCMLKHATSVTSLPSGIGELKISFTNAEPIGLFGSTDSVTLECQSNTLGMLSSIVYIASKK